MSSVTMKYGGFSIKPVPMISIGKTYQKNAAGIAVGTVFDINLNGNIVLTGTLGLPAIFSGIRDIRNCFDRDGKLFQILCDDTVLLECYPRIIDQIRFNESPDHWINACPYSITLECDSEPVNIGIAGSGENVPSLMPGYLTSYSDNYSFEFDNSSFKYTLSTSTGIDTNALIIRASRELQAQGKSHWVGPNLTGTLEKPAWMWAKEFCLTKINADPINALTSGIFNVSSTGWNQYDRFIIQKISESDGSFSVSETFILGNKSNGIKEDFSVEIRTSQQDPLTSVNIQGTIEGLEERVYGSGAGQFNIAKTKFENASNYFESIRDNILIYPRAQAIVTTDNIALNINPMTRSIGRSPTKGIITYSYEYNNRPSNCITGSKVENIQIQDENPSDIFARIQILGRHQGPILQSFNTISDFKRTITIDLIMTPPTGCSISTLVSGNNPSNQVSSILCGFENDLRGRYDKVYKERDSVGWEPKSGRYNRTVSWAAVPCTTVPPISLCSGA